MYQDKYSLFSYELDFPIGLNRGIFFFNLTSNLPICSVPCGYYNPLLDLS